MESFVSAAEKSKFCNTLLCLLKALENRCTTIDLRNEISVTGKITQVDGCMNVVLSDAALFDPDGKYHYLPLMYIHARNIRNVHIPDNISIKKTIEKQVTFKQKGQETKKRTFKESRAQKRQQETLKLVKEMKEQQAIGMKEQQAIGMKEQQATERKEQQATVTKDLQAMEIKTEIKEEPKDLQATEIKTEVKEEPKDE